MRKALMTYDEKHIVLQNISIVWKAVIMRNVYIPRKHQIFP